MSDALYNKCRVLAYELRVEDAIQNLKEAEKARARERGYQFNETFSFHASPHGLIEASKWAIGRSVQNLTPTEQNELLGAMLCSLLLGRAQDEVLAVTLGSNLRWPGLEDWFRRFKDMKYWPPQWEVYPVGKGETVAEFYEGNLDKPTDSLLATIHSFSLNARQLLLDGWLGYTNAKKSRLNRENYDNAIEELVSVGFAVRRDDLPLAERMCLLPISKVRELQRTHGVKGARSKEQIVNNLLSFISEATLTVQTKDALSAGGFYPDSHVKLNVGYRKLDRYWFEYARAKLLAETLLSMAVHYNRLRDFQKRERSNIFHYRMKVLMIKEIPKCPFCAEAAKRFDAMRQVTLNAMPPFHPGCTCGLGEEIE